MVTPWFGWHTDVTAAVNPPCASILRGVTIPPYGGDTFWTNLVAAYAGLRNRCGPSSMGCAAFTRSSRAAMPRPGAIQRAGQTPRVEKRASACDRPCGDRGAGAVRQSILPEVAVDLPRGKVPRYGYLWEHSVRPEYTVRFKWNPGDIAFWDNRSTAHLAPRDIFQSDFDRQLYRITLVGEPLVGVDGRSSSSIEGLPIRSAAEELRMIAAE